MKSFLFVFALFISSTMYCMLEQQRLQSSGLLCDLVKNKKLAEVQKLLEQTGREIIDEAGSDGEPPLHWASILGLFDMAKLLLDKEADPNKLDVHGDTPLHSAAFNNRFKVMKVLLDHGAIDKISHKANNGLTPLGAARQNHSKESEQLLLSFGA